MDWSLWNEDSNRNGYDQSFWDDDDDDVEITVIIVDDDDNDVGMLLEEEEEEEERNVTDEEWLRQAYGGSKHSHMQQLYERHGEWEWVVDERHGRYSREQHMQFRMRQYDENPVLYANATVFERLDQRKSARVAGRTYYEKCSTVDGRLTVQIGDVVAVMPDQRDVRSASLRRRGPIRGHPLWLCRVEYMWEEADTGQKCFSDSGSAAGLI